MNEVNNYDYLEMEMVSIPATSDFQMGWEGISADEAPVHSVSLDKFTVGKYEITYGLWLLVKYWAESEGYEFANEGYHGGALDSIYFHPVTKINWRDCIAWCNAYSEFKGFDPVYFTTPEKTTLYRNSTKDVDIGNDCVDWDSNGYRLLTEAEWEYSARYIDSMSVSSGAMHSGCNLYPDINDCAWYAYNADGDPHPVGKLQPNNSGLYDMSGNQWEWCWDRYDSEYYSRSPVGNPKGPNTGDNRVQRGGHWNYEPRFCRTAYRYKRAPTYYYGSGFRICRVSNK